MTLTLTCAATLPAGDRICTRICGNKETFEELDASASTGHTLYITAWAAGWRVIDDRRACPTCSAAVTDDDPPEVLT